MLFDFDHLKIYDPIWDDLSERPKRARVDEAASLEDIMPSQEDAPSEGLDALIDAVHCAPQLRDDWARAFLGAADNVAELRQDLPDL